MHSLLERTRYSATTRVPYVTIIQPYFVPYILYHAAENQPYWCITNISQESPSRSIPYVPPIGIDLFRSTGTFLTYDPFAPVGLN